MIRYYALHADDAPVREATGLMRELDETDSHDVQFVNRDGQWQSRPELYRYLVGLDDGATRVDASTARQIVTRLGFDAEELIGDGDSGA